MISKLLRHLVIIIHCYHGNANQRTRNYHFLKYMAEQSAPMTIRAWETGSNTSDNNWCKVNPESGRSWMATPLINCFFFMLATVFNTLTSFGISSRHNNLLTKSPLIFSWSSIRLYKRSPTSNKLSKVSLVDKTSNSAYIKAQSAIILHWLPRDSGSNLSLLWWHDPSKIAVELYGVWCKMRWRFSTLLFVSGLL